MRGCRLHLSFEVQIVHVHHASAFPIDGVRDLNMQDSNRKNQPCARFFLHTLKRADDNMHMPFFETTAEDNVDEALP